MLLLFLLLVLRSCLNTGQFLSWCPIYSNSPALPTATIAFQKRLQNGPWRRPMCVTWCLWVPYAWPHRLWGRQGGRRRKPMLYIYIYRYIMICIYKYIIYIYDIIRIHLGSFSASIHGNISQAFLNPPLFPQLPQHHTYMMLGSPWEAGRVEDTSTIIKTIIKTIFKYH